MACVMTSSPTRLITWSTFSTPTRIDVDSLSACAAVAGRAAARAPVVTTSAAAADSAAGASGAAGAGAAAASATGAASAGAALLAGTASRAMFSWSPSTMKQHTASISSGVQVLSTQTVSTPLARSLALTVPRLPISSSRDAASLSDTFVIRTRSGRPSAPADGSAGAGWGACCTGTGAGAGAAMGAGAAGAGAAAGSLCSSASCLNTAQIRSNTASSGSSEAR
ncbi:hypothetical protein D3C71_1422230 [compost metagenome]